MIQRDCFILIHGHEKKIFVVKLKVPIYLLLYSFIYSDQIFALNIEKIKILFF